MASSSLLDSGDELERIHRPAQLQPSSTPTTATSPFDNRSDAKGPEPEGVAIGKVGGRTYAFIGS